MAKWHQHSIEPSRFSWKSHRASRRMRSTATKVQTTSSAKNKHLKFPKYIKVWSKHLRCERLKHVGTVVKWPISEGDRRHLPLECQPQVLDGRSRMGKSPGRTGGDCTQEAPRYLFICLFVFLFNHHYTTAKHKKQYEGTRLVNKLLLHNLQKDPTLQFGRETN